MSLNRLYRPHWLYPGILCLLLSIVSMSCTAGTPPAMPETLASDTVLPAPTTVTISKIVTEVRDGETQITVATSGEVHHTAFSLQDPPRLVVDLADATMASDVKALDLPDGVVSSIEPLVFPDKQVVRLLMPLRHEANHAVTADGQHVRIALTEAAPRQTLGHAVKDSAAMATSPAASGAPTDLQTAATESSAETVVKGIAFESLLGASVIAVKLDGALPQMRVKQRIDPLRLTMDVSHARLAPDHDDLMAIHDPAGIVKQVQSVQSQQGEEATVHIVAYLESEAPFEVRQDDDEVRMIITKPVMETAASHGEANVTASTASAVAWPNAPLIAQATPASPDHLPKLGQNTPAGSTDDQGVPKLIAPTTIRGQTNDQYTGEKISLDFQNADINDILRLIAEVSGLNIIAGPDVKGTITTRMVDVPWDQALDVILKINGLDQERDDNIVRIAPVSRFINEREERIRALQAVEKSEPMVTQIVPVSYADVGELKTNLERVLSERGTIWVDSRTGTLVVTDVQRNVDDALELIKTLDRQTPQVMIESRIVEASRDFLHELGVQLGAAFSHTTDRKFPSTVDVGGGVAGANNGNFLVDLPAAVGAGSGGAITFALAGANSLLNIQLSALEESGKGKIVTNPKIATLDNTEAVIESGRRIPYSTISEDGTKTEFVDASIELRVTPHISPDGFIDLKILATKNEADFSNTSANGVPTILTREATTNMLVRDGDTVVIGGLYKRTTQESRNGVPWLSDVPGLGWLFRKNLKRDEHEELLIFITPRIIKQPSVPSRAQASLWN